MIEYSPIKSTYIRYLHELLLSFNVATALVWAKSATTSNWEVYGRIKNLFSSPSYGSDNYAAGFPAFFLPLRLFAKVGYVEGFLYSIGGILSLLAVPAAWFYVHQVLGFTPFEPSAYWLLIEGAVTITCVSLYLRGRWPIAAWGNILLISLHYIFWAWILRRHFLGNPLGLVFPIIGLASGFAWSLYLWHRSVKWEHSRRLRS